MCHARCLLLDSTNEYHDCVLRPSGKHRDRCEGKAGRFAIWERPPAIARNCQVPQWWTANGSKSGS